MALFHVLNYLTPRVGRFNATQLRRLGQALYPCGFFSIGPLVVLIDLPERWHKTDDEVPLDDLNAYLRDRYTVSN